MIFYAEYRFSCDVVFDLGNNRLKIIAKNMFKPVTFAKKSAFVTDFQSYNARKSTVLENNKHVKCCTLARISANKNGLTCKTANKFDIHTQRNRKRSISDYRRNAPLSVLGALPCPYILKKSFRKCNEITGYTLSTGILISVTNLLISSVSP